MAKKKINKGLEAARQKLTADFLESSGVPKGRDRTKLIKEIKQHADTGGMSWPEAHEEALTNWREETLAKQLKEISKINEKERKEQKKAKPKKKETPLPLEEDAYQIALKVGSEKQTAEKATNTAAISKAIRAKEEKSAAGGPSVARDRADAAKKNIKDRGGKPVADLMRATPLSKAIMEHGAKGKDKELTKHVLGVTDKAINFVALNPKLFEDGLEGDTATRLVEQAVDIANASLKATEENAPQLLGQLLYLEKIAIDAKDSEVAKLIKEIIGPVKESLKKKAGWKGLLKSKVKNYIGNIPKTLVEKIPVIGGFLGEMMGRNKQVKESTEQSAGAIEEGVSRGTGRGTIASQGLRKAGKGSKEDEIGGDGGIGGIGGVGGIGGIGGIGGRGDGGIGGIGGVGGIGGRGDGGIGGIGGRGDGGIGGIGGRGDGFGGGNGIIQILQSGFESIRIELVEIKGILKDFLVSPESKLKEKEKEFELGGKNKLDLGKKQTESKSGGKIGGFFGGIFDGLLNNIEKIGKKKTQLIDAAKAIAALGASLIPLAIALRIMKEVGFKTVGVLAASLLTLGLAGVILGKNKSTMIQGALAIAALGASLIPLAFALNLVKDVGFKSILVLAAALVTFGLAAALIGMPAVLPFILLGALGIAALGVALIPLAFALNLATPAIEAFGTVVSAVGQSISDILHSFIEFGNPIIGVGLLSAAMGIGAVTVALLAFSAASAAMKIGGAAAGLVSGVMGFFTGGAPPSAIEMLALFAEFGKSAPLLEQAANAITKLADALKYFSGIKEIPTGNLEALSRVGEVASKIPASNTGSGAPSTKKSRYSGLDPQDINDFRLSPEDSIKSDERTANDVQNALQKRKDTGQTVAPKLTGGETREETINGQTTTRTVAPYPEYTAGTQLTEREMAVMDMQVGGGFVSTNSDTPGGEGYNTISIPDIKLEQYLKQKRETISDAKSALTPNAGMITPSPNTDVGKQVKATQTARAELDAAQNANLAAQSKGNTTVQTNIGGAKSNTVNVNNSGDGVRDTKSTLEVARKESR